MYNCIFQTDRPVSSVFKTRDGQSATRESILCSPPALTKIYTPILNQAQDLFFLSSALNVSEKRTCAAVKTFFCFFRSSSTLSVENSTFCG